MSPPLKNNDGVAQKVFFLHMAYTALLAEVPRGGGSRGNAPGPVVRNFGKFILRKIDFSNEIEAFALKKAHKVIV